MTPDAASAAPPPPEPPPPFGGRWGVLYAIVLVALAACIAALAWLSRWGA